MLFPEQSPESIPIIVYMGVEGGVLNNIHFSSLARYLEFPHPIHYVLYLRSLLWQHGKILIDRHGGKLFQAILSLSPLLSPL